MKNEIKTPAVDEDLALNRESYERLRSEVEHLKTVRRPEVSERLLRAREFGDIRENGEYDAAKDEQGLLESRIRKLDYLLSHSQIRDVAVETEVAGPGVIVSVRDGKAGEEEEYYLSQTAEERLPGLRTITTSSSLGKALLGHKPGETVSFEAPGGKFSYQIIALRPA